MQVYATIVTVFAEMLLVAVSVAGFALLVHEFKRRREPALLLFAFAFALHALMISVYFMAQVLAAFEQIPSAMNTFRAALSLAAASGAMFCVAVARPLRPFVRRIVKAAAGIWLVISVALLANGDMNVSQVNGMAFGKVSSSVVLFVYAPLLFFALGAVIVRRHKHKLAGTTSSKTAWVIRALFAAIIVLFLVGAWLITANMESASMVGTIVCLAVGLGIVAVSVATDDHPDEHVRRNPMALFSRSLLLKAVGLNALMLWVMSFVILAVLSSLFVSQGVQDRQVALRRDLQYFVKAYQSRGFALLEVASRDALSAEAIGVAAGQVGGAFVPHPDVMSEAVPLVRIVDTDHIVRMSTFAIEEIGAPYARSGILDAALRGERSVSWEYEEAFQTWAIKAAVPIYGETGVVIGAVLRADVDRSFIVEGATSATAASVSGYGFVSGDGALVFRSGDALDVDALAATTNALVRARDATLRAGDRTIYLAAVPSIVGGREGYFYVYITDAEADAQAFGIIAAISLLLLCGITLMVALMLSGMGAVLRPLREMREAATRLSLEEGVGKVRYDSPDEVGQLASAFNKTVDVVHERTSALTAAIRERQDFLDHATRELRAPLDVLRLTLQTIRFGDREGKMTREQFELLEKLHQTNERLVRMVGNLHDLNLVDRDRMHLVKRPIVMEDMLDDVAGEMAIAARTKGVDLHWERPAKRLPEALADAACVQKALHNIVENAVKYTQPDGTVELKVEVADAASPDPSSQRGTYIKVTVADTGIGVPNEERRHLFGRFYRAQNVAEFEIEGAGLGLYLAKRFVELQGGSIWLESREGEGTTVTFTLPAAPSRHDDETH